MWTGDNLWHRTVICHNSNCMELELAPKGKDMSSLLVFSTLEAINLSLAPTRRYVTWSPYGTWAIYIPPWDMPEVPPNSAVAAPSGSVASPGDLSTLWTQN